MLESLWNLLTGVVIAIWGLLTTVVGFVCDLAIYLHVETPRLEGLLVGILLAWLLSRRDQHPLLRAASAPLKLILDILDIAWDQGLETLSDLYGTAKQWTVGSVNWGLEKVKSLYSSLVSKLRSTKENLDK